MTRRIWTSLQFHPYFYATFLLMTSELATEVNTPEWLDQILRKQCRVPSLRPHQLRHGMDLVNGKDLFLVIATSQGKTLVLHAPLIAAQARGDDGIGLLIAPTKVLVDQHAEVATRNGLHALAIHEDSVRESGLSGRDLFSELASYKGVRLGVMSPQMLLGKRMGKHLSQIQFKGLVNWFLIDEAHLADEDSGTFLNVYRALSMMRARLLSKTVWAAVTGSATPERAQVIAKFLGFQPGHYVNARYSIDRPTVKYIPRFFRHATSGHEFFDLSFIIPFQMKSVLEIEPTLIFATTINTCYRIMQFLDRLISHSIPERLSVVKLYNSMMSPGYRQTILQDFQNDSSSLRVIVATDTCTYGLDLPNIRRTVVFDMCPSPENLKQKIGRPGRDGKPAVAITFAPSWVREVPKAETQGKQAQEDFKRRLKLPPVMRQWFNPTPSLCSRGADVRYNGEEFLKHLNCCSMHDPNPEEFRDLAIVECWIKHFKEAPVEGNTASERSKPLRSDRTYRELTKAMKDSLHQLLMRWRGNIWASLRGSLLGTPSSVFMPQPILLRIVERAHICSSLSRLEIICDGWDYFDSHGATLFEYLGKILKGFNEMWDEEDDRSERETQETHDDEGKGVSSDDEGHCSDMGLSPSVCTPTLISVTAPASGGVRLVLHPKEMHQPKVVQPASKRLLSPAPRAGPNKRRRRKSNKENEYTPNS
ncbi:hypothetical protein D9615_009902 [Tricholomella constricta]|uniref:DNA 3'-5' helicase n=1 Tax=Tricholomella constricta TaxID=117010 RepID=A0A8H5GZN8_9AGAR|nr:hypothetical protein D9615_009902 [Tricholomella constricta]